MTNRDTRPGGRAADTLRNVQITTGISRFAEGSAQIDCGLTRVHITASVERRVPPFLKDSGQGWVTAEYSMLPRSTHTRSQREVGKGRSGRTSEIQRLIGRSLRAVVDMSRLPERTVTLDCDVLQADGGTRTASITGAYVALVEAMAGAYLAGDIDQWPITDGLAAVSVGLVQDQARLDLEYVEDSRAQVDLNVVGTASGRFVEVQGTGEDRSFSRQEMDDLLDLAMAGIGQLVELQNQALQPTLAAVAAARERRQQGPAVPKNEREVWGRPKR